MYCVNCGVKLADTEQICPLCGVAAFHPDIARKEAEDLYPPSLPNTPKVSHGAALIVVTTAFLMPLFITLLCDLQVNGTITWSGYVIGALLLGYICFVLPQWFHKPHPVIFTPCDFAAVGLYLLYINNTTGGEWFFGFALPIVGVIGIIVTTVTVLLCCLRRGKLYIFGGAFVALGVFMPVMEQLLNITFHRDRFIGWSFYPLIALVLLGGMLIFLAIWRPARETMERKFFL